MGMWTAITVIVVACVFGEALRRKWERGGSGETDKRLDELNDRLDRLDADLRERVQTLERIVTDRKQDLEREFDRLDKAS